MEDSVSVVYYMGLVSAINNWKSELLLQMGLAAIVGHAALIKT